MGHFWREMHLATWRCSALIPSEDVGRTLREAETVREAVGASTVTGRHVPFDARLNTPNAMRSRMQPDSNNGAQELQHGDHPSMVRICSSTAGL